MRRGGRSNAMAVEVVESSCEDEVMGEAIVKFRRHCANNFSFP